MSDSRETLVYYRDNGIQKESISEKEKQVLDFINQKIAAGNSLEEILHFYFHQMQHLIPADRIGIAFFEENGSRMVLYHVITGYSPVYLDSGYTADSRGSSLEQVFSSETPRVINDLEAYYLEHPLSESTQLLLKENIMSSMTCPLRVEKRPVGLLFFSSKNKSAYSSHDIMLHLAVSERLSQAVEKAWTINRMAQSMSSYMEMLGFVSHELKSPLDSIITLGTTMVQGYMGELSEKHRDYIDRMVKKAQYLRDMAAEYLTLSRFESSAMELKKEKTDFNADILRESLEIIQPQLEEKKITLTTAADPGLPVIACDRMLMKIVVNNLLSNAVKYSNTSGSVDITCSAAENTFMFTVRNTGPGFSPDQKYRLFKKFSRLESKELMKRKGSGIGLYTSWKIIQFHNGRIRADSDEGQWAEFSFEIPLS
ncbi:MAG: hypothetical protein CVV44_20535 [Spirochaetae bacterium HGW-Spirochaetae-1]|jgi:signal transduction histidine kinase|nr:MAG: hypothetical protein CVV44_20535 [Spirochaetae bacterium HGW-Spirochaetae-1]